MSASATALPSRSVVVAVDRLGEGMVRSEFMRAMLSERQQFFVKASQVAHAMKYDRPLTLRKRNTPFRKYPFGEEVHLLPEDCEIVKAWVYEAKLHTTRSGRILYDVTVLFHPPVLAS